MCLYKEGVHCQSVWLKSIYDREGWQPDHPQILRVWRMKYEGRMEEGIRMITGNARSVSKSLPAYLEMIVLWLITGWFW